MSEDLASIDVSHLDALSKLEADQHALQELLEKAARRRDKEVEVYSRVMADYQVRIASISKQVSTVRERVRDDLRKLEALHDRSRDALDQATVQLHECEFRHEIGEFTEEEFHRCQQAAQRTIGERESEFDSVKKLRLRYMELLPGEPVPPVAPAPAPATGSVAARAPVPSAPPSPAAAAAPGSPPPPAAAVDPPTATGRQPVSRDTGATIFLRPPSATDFLVPSPGKPAGGEELFGTIALAAATLMEDLDGLPGARHRLGMLTMIGRTTDNQIVVPSKEVSRRHAEIVLKDGGYVVRDLETPNGTFVNGERITEHRLREGDKLAMGGKVFVFKAP